MKNRVLWLILSCLMVVALVLASCAPAAKPTAPTVPTAPTIPTTPTVPTTPTTPMLEPTKPITAGKPTYGGTITITEPNWLQLETYRADPFAVKTTGFVGERLVVGDWAIDRNVYSFPITPGYLPLEYMRGLLLESWETPDPLTIILHVRQGVHWQDKPPVNGRELSADDIVWNIERYKKDPFVARTELDQIQSVNKKDKWTVELRLTPPPQVGIVRAIFDTGCLFFWPKEATGPTGEITDWHNLIGTGPFMIEDYVADSCVTFKRNPSYWGFDERHPENRLPYADVAKVLLIADPSTKYAAMRTGKIYWDYSIPWQDADNLQKTCPRLLSRGLPAGSPNQFRMRYDTPPFNDVRVRQTMNMAIDRNEIIKSFYNGHAYYYIAMLGYYLGRLHTPYEKLPDKPMWTTVSCKEVLTYNPQKAKELLAAAGYPNGFKTHIDTTPTRDNGISELLQSYLAKIGVQAEIKAYESSAYTAMKYGKQCTQLLMTWDATHPDPMYMMTILCNPGHMYNYTAINDPYFTNLYLKARSELDDTKREKMLVEIDLYNIENAFEVLFPHCQEMMVWQPWLEGYAGEGPLGYAEYGALFARIWVDQELKKSLGF